MRCIPPHVSFRPSDFARPLALAAAASAISLASPGFTSPAVAQKKAAKPPAGKPSAKPSAGSVVPPPVGYALYNRALEAAAAGKTDEAIRLCRQIVKEEPDAAAVWATLAQLLARSGKTDEALSAITKATIIAPDVAAFWGERANLESQARRWDDSVASAQKALTRDPKNDPALAALATAYLQTKRFKEAVPALRRLSSARGGLDMAVGQNLVLASVQSGDLRGALDVSRKLAAKYPNRPETHLSVADLSARTGNYAGAYAALQKARALKPGDYTVLLNTALAADALGRREEALGLLADLAKAHPKSGAPWFHRGRILYAEDRRGEQFAQAEKAFAEAVEREPKNALYRAHLGMARMFQGTSRADEARASFDRALADDPRSETAHLGLAYLDEQAKRWDQAAGSYESALASNPENHFARRRRAGALYYAGRKDDAYREFWELASRDAKNAVPHLKELASLLLADGKYSTARAAYAQVLERAPGDPAALVGTALAFEKENNFAAAEQQYRAALAAHPTFADGYRLLAELLVRTNRAEDRAKLMRQWLAADPTSNEARWDLALLYREQGRDEEALREMRMLTLRKGDPNRLNYRLGPAALYLHREKWAQAAAEYEKVLAEEPGEDAIRYPLAYAYEKMGRFGDAEKLLRDMESKAAVRTPEARPGPKAALAGLYERAKRYPEARGLYEEVVTLTPGHSAAVEGLKRVGAATGDPGAATGLLERLATASPEKPNLAAAASLERLLTQGAKTDYEGYVAFARRLAAKYPASAEAKTRAEQAAQRYGGSATATPAGTTEKPGNGSP